MRLEKPGWLEGLLREAVSQHRPPRVDPKLLEGLKTPQARARAALRELFRSSGLAYGTPLTPSAPDTQPELVLFEAVLRTLCTLGLDLAVLVEAAPGPRAEQLLLLFAAMTGRLQEAADLHRRIERATKQWPLPAKVWRTVEQALAERSQSLASDPYYGLVLHNGAVYADANLFGHVAIAYFGRSTFPLEAAQRRVLFAAQLKARLVEVLVGLVCAERPPSFPTRRAILQQIEHLQLPPSLDGSTRDFARRAFRKPPPLERLTDGVHSRALKQFIVEQVLLASLVDGRRSPPEIAWTHALAGAFGFSRDEVQQLELRMASFYRTNRNVVDVFTVASGAEVMGEEWVDELSVAVRRNSRALLKEIRKTGQLSVLLARAARGQTLSTEDKRHMRAQLIDVAKAIPSLAAFVAPGGLLLLMALARVLPFDLRPTSFREEDDDEVGQPPRLTQGRPDPP